MSTFGKAVIELAADTAKFTSDIGRAAAQFERAIGRMEEGVKNLKDAALGLIGFGGMDAAFSEIMRRTMEAERSVNQLNAVLQSTGHAAGFSRGQIEDMADALSKSSVFDNDDIRQGINALLRFQQVQGDTFKEGARLAVDLAAALGTSLPDAFTKVGRALSDPERGMRALREAGVFLSESQSELAKKLFATGDAASAQKIILDELQKSVGGAAQGENRGLYGGTKAVAKAWDEFLKGLGGMEHTGSRVTRILDGITTSLKWMTSLIPEAQQSMQSRFEEHQASLAAAAAESARVIAATQSQVDKEIESRQKKARADYLAREERLRQEDIKGWIAHADAVFKEAEENDLAIAKIWDEHWAREEKLRQEDIRGWVAHAEAVFQAADEENLALAKIADQAKKTDNIARDLGLTFESAFEKAVIGGQKFSDVLKGLAQDLARIALRKTVTEPIAGAASGFFGNLFSGGLGSLFGGGGGVDLALADGGSFSAGDRLLVGEQGPEIVQFGMGGNVVPNHALGASGPTFNVDMRGASVEAVARLEQLVRQVNGSIESRAVRAVSMSRARGR